MPRRFHALVLALAVVVVACSPSGQPEAIRRGRSIYGDTCSVCHGAAGQGGIGPTLEIVVATWPDCRDHVEWIALGSEGWRARHGDTFGAADRPIAGGMPGHEGRLALEDMRRVAAFERFAYGGVDAEAALAQCDVSSD